MASPIAPATTPDRAGKPAPSPSETVDAPPFGALLDSQIAASSVPLAPYPAGNTLPAPNTGNTSEASGQRLERSNPRQGNRRQRK